MGAGSKKNTMKLFLAALFALVTSCASGQNYPFAKTFMNGQIILKDGTKRNGQIKWFPDQNEKLKFRKTEKSAIEKFSPEALSGFIVDTLHYVSLFNFDVFADDYALWGRQTKVKHSFGQLLDSGSFNIYFVLVTFYSALSGSLQSYPNFLFEKKSDSVSQYAAFPYGTRMRAKKYEKAREMLYDFFRDYPGIVDKLKGWKQTDDFFSIVDLMKTMN